MNEHLRVRVALAIIFSMAGARAGAAIPIDSGPALPPARPESGAALPDQKNEAPPAVAEVQLSDHGRLIATNLAYSLQTGLRLDIGHGTAPLTIAPGLVRAIRFSPDAGNRPERLVSLRNGAILAASRLQLEADGITMATAWADGLRIPANALAAIDLRPELIWGRGRPAALAPADLAQERAEKLKQAKLQNAKAFQQRAGPKTPREPSFHETAGSLALDRASLLKHFPKLDAGELLLELAWSELPAIAFQVLHGKGRLEVSIGGERCTLLAKPAGGEEETLHSASLPGTALARRAVAISLYFGPEHAGLRLDGEPPVLLSHSPFGAAQAVICKSYRGGLEIRHPRLRARPADPRPWQEAGPGARLSDGSWVQRGAAPDRGGGLDLDNCAFLSFAAPSAIPAGIWVSLRDGSVLPIAQLRIAADTIEGEAPGLGTVRLPARDILEIRFP